METWKGTNEGFGALLDNLDRGGGHCNYLLIVEGREISFEKGE
jgi:hypothetical protein